MKALEGNLVKLLRSSIKGNEALKEFMLTGRDVKVTLENGKTYKLTNEKRDETCRSSKKRRTQQEIEEGEALYYALLEDELDDECDGWENR